MTTDLNRKIKVINRTSGSLAYNIESLRVVRYWKKPGDYLNIAINELLELKTAAGGPTVLEDLVKIEDKEALSVLFPENDIEPEYHYGEAEIDTLLYEAPIEQLLDALDYAPQGVLEIIKTRAINKLPNTTEKIEAIDKKFNTSIHKIHILQIDQEAQEEEAPKRQRRTKPLIEEKTPEVPKYNVISKED